MSQDEVDVPGICPTCGAVFPSGIVVPDGAILNWLGNVVGPCPNGHMGVIPDGTYQILRGLRWISASDLAKVRLIAESARAQREDPAIALDEIASLLPDQSAAALKNLSTGQSAAAAALLLVLYLITMLLDATGKGIDIVNALVPDRPVTTTIINNHTVNNYAAPRDDSDDAVVKPMKRPQLRRLRQMERQREKRARQRDKGTPGKEGDA